MEEVEPIIHARSPRIEHKLFRSQEYFIWEDTTSSVLSVNQGVKSDTFVVTICVIQRSIQKQGLFP